MTRDVLVLAVRELMSDAHADALAKRARQALADAGRDAVVVIADGCNQALWITDPITGQTPPGGSPNPPSSGE